MDLRAYRSLKAAGATWADSAREAGCDWRTARKYLSEGTVDAAQRDGPAEASPGRRLRPDHRRAAHGRAAPSGVGHP